MVAFAKDVAPIPRGGFFTRDTGELERCASELRAKIKSIRSDKHRAELDKLVKFTFRRDFIGLFCEDRSFSESERKAIIESDQHFYHFTTFPLLRAKSYRGAVSGFVLAAVAPGETGLLDAALTDLASALQEITENAGLPKDEGVDGVALRMIAAEMFYYEMAKNHPSGALMVEALSLALDSFLRIKNNSMVKID